MLEEAEKCTLYAANYIPYLYIIYLFFVMMDSGRLMMYRK